MNWKEFANKNKDWLVAENFHLENDGKSMETVMFNYKDLNNEEWIFIIDDKGGCEFGDFRFLKARKYYETFSFLGQNYKEWFKGVD